MTVCVLALFLLDRMGLNRIGYVLLLTCAVQLGVYLDLVSRSPRRDETLWMHTAVILYLGGNIVFQVLTVLPGGSRDLRDLALTVRGVGSLLFAGVMAMVLNLRSARLQDEQLRLAQEMRAGAEMQELLLPAGAIEVPGFTSEAAYLPMSEVGGDFYWTRAEPGGGLLVVVGDVSGKGLKAAMVVWVTIGILRTVKSTAPTAILASMNEGLAGHMGGERAASVRFTFVSDGVVEAENAQRELFGFDRTLEISGKSALEIAEVAQAWGQNDDITVVTVRRNG